MAGGTRDQQALLRRDGDASFQQQGTIDWTRISTSAVSFGIGFLVRLSKAGVEPLTVVTVQATLSKLKLSNSGEERVQNAVQNLRAFPSFNSALWFGFGIRHIIYELAQTREGLNCIALCSALVEFYSIPDTAKILREMMLTSNAPQDLTPSLKQWITLVGNCGGAFAATDFGAVVHSIARFLLSDGDPSMRMSSDPEAIARALQGTMAISNGSLGRMQLSGGIDCAVFAAISQWLLDVPVEIRSVEGQTLYRSFSTASSESKVLIVFDKNPTLSMKVTQRTYIIPSGAVIVPPVISELGPEHHLISFGRVPWEQLLSSTFGQTFEDLCSDTIIRHFLIALGCAARMLTGLITEDVDLLSKDLQHFVVPIGQYNINSKSHGRGFIQTIRQFLPEIAQSEHFTRIMNHALSLDWDRSFTWYDGALQTIRLSCECLSCSLQRGRRCGSLKNLDAEFCQDKLVSMIIKLVRTLSSKIFYPVEPELNYFTGVCASSCSLSLRVVIRKRGPFL